MSNDLAPPLPLAQAAGRGLVSAGIPVFPAK